VLESLVQELVHLSLELHGQQTNYPNPTIITLCLVHMIPQGTESVQERTNIHLSSEMDRRNMRIGAFGDLHGDRYMEFLIPSLEDLAAVDLLLLAGDISDRGNLEPFRSTVALLKEHTDAPVIAVFGNEEYQQDHERYRRELPGSFLDDGSTTFELEGMLVRVVGTRGSLDRPTWWQRNNVPGIWRSYGERVERISELLRRGEEDLLILLSHYSPTRATLEGEDPGRYEEMGSRAMEGVLELRRPDLVIHGHAHGGSREGTIGGGQTSLEDFGSERRAVPVFNVALPLAREITILDVRRDVDGFHITRV